MRAIAAAVVVASFTHVHAEPLVESSAEALSPADLFKVAVHAAPELESVAVTAMQTKAQVNVADGPHDFGVLFISDFQRSFGAPVIAGQPGNASTTITNTLDIRKLLPTNGVLEVIGQIAESKTDTFGLGTDVITSSARLQLTQPLLRGVGSAVANELPDVARIKRDAAAIRVAGQARAFAAEVMTAYWSLALAWRKLAIRRTGIELAKKQLAIVEASVRVSKSAPSELIPVQELVQTRQQDILTAELDVIEQSITLRRIVGMDVDRDHVGVKTAELPAPEPVALDVAAIVHRALEVSDDLKAAIEDDRAARRGVASSRRQLPPRVDLRINGGPLGADSTQFDAAGNITHNPNVLGSIKQLASGYSFGANLAVELPIGNRQLRGTYQAGLATAYDTAFQVGRTRADVAALAIRLVNEAQHHLDSAQVGAKAVAFAEQGVEVEIKKFENGKSSSAEIVRREDDLELQRLRQAVEITAYTIALAQLQAVTGTILEAHGLKVLQHAAKR